MSKGGGSEGQGGRVSRTRARRRALDILYEADIRGESPLVVLERCAKAAEPAVTDYTRLVVEGVHQRADRIDELIETYADGWELERMPPVDRNIIRIGAYELLWLDDVPDGVAISEAVSMARDLSADESPTFINGLLARFEKLKPQLAL